MKSRLEVVMEIHQHLNNVSDVIAIFFLEPHYKEKYKYKYLDEYFTI